MFFFKTEVSLVESKKVNKQKSKSKALASGDINPLP